MHNMISIKNISNKELDSIQVDSFWNSSKEKELKMHRIHAYPAKFPAFIVNKALDFAGKNGVKLNRVADIFCGCGTVAFEARRNNINFWGYDINPVATMIAKAKSRKYNDKKLNKYYKKILQMYSQSKKECQTFEFNDERLKYWYTKKQFNELSILKSVIEQTLPARSDYRSFFLCAFSNILKPTSRWLTKSIKPQIDPDKISASVLKAFKEQCQFMFLANEENDITSSSKIKIETINFLDQSNYHPKVDMVITSPPYVTSYEYADLHQLSSLWLGYTKDYRNLRKGSIGSIYHCYEYERELKNLNRTGKRIHSELINKDTSKARSVAKYFLDMQKVTKNCFKMLSKNGMALFVIGNTEYKRVRIDNALHLAESLRQSGFREILASKRKISKKILTPYRDKRGRFTADGSGRRVYGEEFILIGKK